MKTNLFRIYDKNNNEIVDSRLYWLMQYGLGELIEMGYKITLCE